MLLIASQRLKGSQALNDVAREMSLSTGFFTSPETLAQRLDGSLRRIVLLSDADVSHDIVDCLCAASAKTSIGLLVAADRPRLRGSEKAFLIDRLRELPIVDWIGGQFDFERLADSARFCRRRMLRIRNRELETAFEADEFLIRYQPKVERDGSAEWVTREAEALVRWNHPEHGWLSPLEFLPEIEEFGMASRLAEYVLQKTAAQLVKWDQQGMPLKGCINLSSSLLADEGIAARFAAIAMHHAIDCRRFTFELVEYDLADPSAPHLRTLAALRERGFRLSLDDFRVAAASLATLERLPFDEIKIHGSALSRAKDDPIALKVLAAVTGLAHNLGMSVCAEGIEDQSTFELMETIDCDKMQGFLISEAVMPDIIRQSYSASDAGVEVA